MVGAEVFAVPVDETATPQEKNRQWWESLPMTYEDWAADDRTTVRDRVVSRFLEFNPYLTPAYFAAFSGRCVLEIGCGAGPVTALFAEAGADVTAIDLTETAVAMACAHEPRPMGLQMDAEAMTFPDSSFDAVFSWGSSITAPIRTKSSPMSRACFGRAARR